MVTSVLLKLPPTGQFANLVSATSIQQTERDFVINRRRKFTDREINQTTQSTRLRVVRRGNVVVTELNHLNNVYELRHVGITKRKYVEFVSLTSIAHWTDLKTQDLAV